jgi:hypothetical protein
MSRHWSSNTVETESLYSATHTKRAGKGKINPVVIEMTGEEDTVVPVLCDSRTREMLRAD